MSSNIHTPTPQDADPDEGISVPSLKVLCFAVTIKWIIGLWMLLALMNISFYFYEIHTGTTQYSYKTFCEMIPISNGGYSRAYKCDKQEVSAFTSQEHALFKTGLGWSILLVLFLAELHYYAQRRMYFMIGLTVALPITVISALANVSGYEIVSFYGIPLATLAIAAGAFLKWKSKTR